ncbi:hypothetical protein ACWOFR_10620 [Carnobacterium gallinarum]|uniref:hypothetical protein n=1 Tax=Carnobacterium gallinarum TaxID=2749 RepID=UPI00054F4F25|nr:hypothetical protein [Carnobacterium gallinarum]
MEFKLARDSQQVLLYFGAPLTQLIENQHELFKQTSHFLIIVNQTNYDSYYEKIQLLLRKQRQQYWYVCPNNSQSSNLAEFERVLSYSIEMELDTQVCVIAFGDAGVIQLSGFFSSVYLGGVTLLELPTTLMSLEQTLGGRAGLNHSLSRNVVSVVKHSRGIFLESRFLRENTLSEIRIGFSRWVRLALGLDLPFYHNLMQEFGTEKQLQEKSLIPYLTSYFALHQLENESGNELSKKFGTEFQQACNSFSEDSRNSSENDVFLISLGFSLFVSVRLMSGVFDLDSWFSWLDRLGYSFILPESWLTSELVERLLKSGGDKKNFLLIVRTSNEELNKVEITLADLVMYVEDYRSWLAEKK